MTLKRSDMQSNHRGKESKRQEIIRKGLDYPDYSKHTAWILGAGFSLMDVWDWEVPENTIVFTMNSSILWAWKDWENNMPKGVTLLGNDTHSMAQYRRAVHYWFALDNLVFTPTMEPEKWYCNIAMRHPNMFKIVEQHNTPNENMPNLRLVLCEKEWQRNVMLDVPYMNKLMRGPTVLIPTLHFAYRCGFKRIVTSGIDFCLVKRGGDLHGQGVEIRRFMDIKGMKKNHELRDQRCVAQNETKGTDKQRVYQCSMMRNHMNAANSMIRELRAKGIEILKTSPAGMLSAPYIPDERTFRAIASGKEIIYNKV